jgi:hypothetical protein
MEEDQFKVTGNHTAKIYQGCNVLDMDGEQCIQNSGELA